MNDGCGCFTWVLKTHVVPFYAKMSQGVIEDKDNAFPLILGTCPTQEAFFVNIKTTKSKGVYYDFEKDLTQRLNILQFYGTIGKKEKQSETQACFRQQECQELVNTDREPSGQYFLTLQQ